MASNRKYGEPRRGGDITAEKRLFIYCRLSLVLGSLQSSLYLVDMRKGGWLRRERLHLKKETQKKVVSVKKYRVFILAQLYNGLLRLYRLAARLNNEKANQPQKESLTMTRIITIKSKRKSILDIFKKSRTERNFQIYTLTPAAEESKAGDIIIINCSR